MLKCFLAAALALVFIFAGCTKERAENPYATPEDTVRVFAEAMKKGDLDAALGCYADTALSSTAGGVEGLSEHELRNLYLKSLEASREPYAKEEITNLETKLLTAEVTYELGGVEHTHPLVNQGGEWKIATDLTR
jgi:hypothetical protein